MSNLKVVFKVFAVLAFIVILQYFYNQAYRNPTRDNHRLSLFYFENIRLSKPRNNLTLELQIPAYKSSNSSISCSALRPKGLIGFVGVKTVSPSIEKVTRLHWDLEDGGHFSPNCTHSDKVAIIVPFRDRMEHLKIFLYNMHPFLKRQLLEYNIFVVEQSGSDPFNRAMLFNVGYSESIKKYNFTCFIFHDVDLLPENDKNVYSCPLSPRHMSVAVDIFRYKLPYRNLFGGITAFRRDHFTKVNGFSNRYWGWGAEDDDMSGRVAYHGLFISRYSPDIARYKMLKHKHQKVNFNRYKILQKGKQRFLSDGLSSLNYTVEEIELTKLYTRVKVKLYHT